MFFQVWWKVRDLGVWHDHDWTIKVDPDAVFLPARMRTWLSGRADTEHGVYFENCRNVQMGFFGNLEVMSTKGPRCSPQTWRIAMRSLRLAPILGVIGSGVHGARTCLPSGAWTGITWRRCRRGMRRPMVRA